MYEYIDIITCTSDFFSSNLVLGGEALASG